MSLVGVWLRRRNIIVYLPTSNPDTDPNLNVASCPNWTGPKQWVLRMLAFWDWVKQQRFWPWSDDGGTDLFSIGDDVSRDVPNNSSQER